MPRYTFTDDETGVEIHCIVDWGMPGSRTYPGEAEHVHSIEVSHGGHLLSSEATTDILSRWDDEALIDAARDIQRDRADDVADHALNLQREDC